MVLLDPRPESFAALAPPSWRRNAVRSQRQLALRARLARLRALCMTRSSSTTSRPASTPSEGNERAAVWRDSLVARYGEALLLQESDREVEALPGLGDLPLIVIRHERPDMFAGLPVADAARAEELWTRLQAELAGTAKGGRIWTAYGAGNDVHVERPDMVTYAVREVLAAARIHTPRSSGVG